MVLGTPNLAIHPDTNVLGTVSAVISIMGRASGQRVKWSIQVNKYLKLWDKSRGQQLIEGLHRCSACRQEATVKVYQPNEFALGGRLWESTYNTNLVLHGLNAFAADKMAQEIQRRDTENGLAKVDV